jgi:polysaccharide transporter, PST family
MRRPSPIRDCETYNQKVPEPGDLSRRSIHGAGVSFVAQIVRVVVQLLSQALLARLVLPADFGLIAMVSPIVSLALIVNQLGLSEATIQRQEISHGELSALFWVNVPVSCMLAGLLAAGTPLVGWLYHARTVVPITYSLSILVLLNGLSAQQMALLNRNMRFSSLATIEVAGTVLGALVGLAAAWEGGGVWSLVAMQAANSVTVTLLAWILCRWVPSLPRKQRGLSSSLRFTGNMTAFNVIDYLSYSVDNVLIGVSSGRISLGLYDRGFKLIFQPLVHALTPFSRVALPTLSRQKDSPERYAGAYLRLLQTMFLLSAPGLLLVISSGNNIVVTVLGERWAAAGPIFRWLAGASLATPFLISTSWLFISQDRSREQLVWGGLGSGLRILSFAVGLPWGPLGVAVAGTIADCLIQTPLLYWVATRKGPIQLMRLCREGYPFVMSGIGIVMVLLLVRETMHANGWSGLLTMGDVSYATFVLLMACHPQGWRTLHDVWQLRSAFRRQDRAGVAAPFEAPNAHQ